MIISKELARSTANDAERRALDAETQYRRGFAEALCLAVHLLESGTDLPALQAWRSRVLAWEQAEPQPHAGPPTIEGRDR